MGTTQIKPIPVTLPIQTSGLEDDSVTDPKIAPQVSTKITGLPPQTQPLNLNENALVLKSGVTILGTVTGAVHNVPIGLDYEWNIDNTIVLLLTPNAFVLGGDRNFITSGLAGITASTTQTQAGAFLLIRDVNEIATVANLNDAVRLPPSFAGKQIVIINNGANILQIFPSLSDDLGQGLNMPTTLVAGAVVRFISYDNVNWAQV